MPAKNDTEGNDWLQREDAEAHDPLRGVLRQVAEALMSAEADAVCGAHWGERRRDRVNSRNGYRTRSWDTQVGTIDLAIPKLRHGTYFPAWLLDPQRRAERELTAAIIEAHGKGVSARRLAALLQSLGMDRLSRSQLWKVTREVDSAVRGMRGANVSAAVRAEVEAELDGLGGDLDGPVVGPVVGSVVGSAAGAPSARAAAVDGTGAPVRNGAGSRMPPPAVDEAAKRDPGGSGEVWTRDNTPNLNRG